ncbi:unnamed protein product [Adineta ricciae]|uniref:Uncharacterized protein n=1 Tax=Adineta ricciae TaxID=249248 RepID=A0A815KF82_ADIRI|nr:unnamed protein product [Adineta ricciae]CAF1394835.1 unnamed protein product [Adineta ricciae]
MTNSEKSSQISKFYLACRNGDVEYVRNYLTTLSPTKWNPNEIETHINSTPLHAASFYGHAEIVKLLLQYGCDRSQTNSYGLTAYEEAANDEIRQLFNRPSDGDSSASRFQDENIADCFEFVKPPKEYVSSIKHGKIKTSTVEDYKTEEEKQLEIGFSTTSIALSQSKLGRFLADRFHPDAPMSLKNIANRLQDLIDREITANEDPQSTKANDLLNKFSNDPDETRGVEYLIRLYTLETKLYHALRQDPMPLALPLYKTLETLKDRYFQGQSYRGAKLDDDDIAIYQNAAVHHQSFLQTKHFSSSSAQRSIAEEFLTHHNKNPSENRRNSVLFTFNFPIHCDQAIDLGRISNEQPCLSEFENEAEILILPWTIFHVDRVEYQSSCYTIYLTNVLLPHKDILSSFKWILTHPKGSMDRFHQHFPKRESQTLKQLLKNISVPEEYVLRKK